MRTPYTLISIQTMRFFFYPAISIILAFSPAASYADKKGSVKPAPTARPAPAVKPNAAKSTDAGSKPVSNPLGSAEMQEDFGKLPTDITSDTLVLHSEERVFVYKGHVVVKQGDMTLLCKVLEGTYNEQNQIEKMVAKGEVVITKQEIKATCQRALYDAVAGTVTLTDNPQLQQKDSVLTADKIKVFLADNRSEAEGNVRVTLIKPEDGKIGIAVGSPTPVASPNTTPKFSTINQPPQRDLPKPSARNTVSPNNSVTPAVTPPSRAEDESD